MEALNKPNRSKLVRFPHYVIAVGAALLLFATAAVYADGPYTMAPPIQPAQDQSYGPSYDTSSVSTDTVFNWRDVPENQQVPIDRAVFDQGGYQLYDSVGETIVVPFTDNNLYVMRFAVSPDNTMFFVNDGNEPTLYVPENGYLENATVSGARWYPFSEQFHPDHPVFIGCAPSWTAFISMGWYPGMICHGGFWCGASFWDGGIFVPTVDLVFVIGGQRCEGWHDFDDFCNRHPDFDHTGFFHPNVYRFADRPHSGDHPFAGGHPWNGNSGNGDRGFSGSTQHFGNGRPGFNTATEAGHNSGFTGQGNRTWSSDGSTHRVFQGANAGAGWNGNRGNSNGGDRTFGGVQHPTNQGGNNPGDRTFGGQNPGAGSGRIFRGGDTGNGGSSSWDNRSFGGGNRTFGGSGSSGQSDAAPARVFSGGSSSGWSSRSSSGGSTYSGGDRSFGGSRSYSGGGSSGGGDRSGGDRNSGGSDRSSNNNSGGGNNGGGRNGGGGGWGR